MVEDDAKDRLFLNLVAANQRRIPAIAGSYTRGGEYWDLCQEILLQMWRGLGSFQGRSAPSTWVCRVALNTAITFRRKNGQRVEPSGRPLEESSPNAVAPSGTGNEILILEELLRSLGKIDRAIFLLYLEDLSYREISEVKGLTENKVGVRVSRLKKTFAQRYWGG